MTVEALLAQLESVRSRGTRRWTAKCPAHADRTPSLSIRQGERGILVRCWAGCELEEVTGALGIRVADLFNDAKHPASARLERLQRTKEKQQKTKANEVNGFTIDALREADYFTRSRQGLDISEWGHEQLNDELHAIADANSLLWTEELAQWI